MRSKTLLVAGAVLAWLLLVQLASAATVGAVTGGEGLVIYNADPGEINYVRAVEESAGVYLLTDLIAVITPTTPECTSISPHAVRCAVPANEFRELRVVVSDRADRVDVAAESVTFVYGGDGADTLVSGGKTPCVLQGGDGDDRLLGGPGRQILMGGAGADRLEGGRGNDQLLGRLGQDVLLGGAGSNELIGNRGQDLIFGGPNTDLIQGGGEDDDLRGGGGDDDMSGGSDNDVLRAGPGRDRLSGGSGVDVFYARDLSRDVVRGGAGRDAAHVDRADAPFPGLPEPDVLFSVEVLF
jgi:Ca2+-binding RTX toxin-like protein